MSERLPRATAAEAIRVLEKAGFLLVRQSGSHKFSKMPRAEELRYHTILERLFIQRF
jgi:predicted RNA binding protein YcfA (HicA-like mRNA interferase family)